MARARCMRQRAHSRYAAPQVRPAAPGRWNEFFGQLWLAEHFPCGTPGVAVAPWIAAAANSCGATSRQRVTGARLILDRILQIWRAGRKALQQPMLITRACARARALALKLGLLRARSLARAPCGWCVLARSAARHGKAH